MAAHRAGGLLGDDVRRVEREVVAVLGGDLHDLARERRERGPGSGRFAAAFFGAVFFRAAFFFAGARFAAFRALPFAAFFFFFRIAIEESLRSFTGFAPATPIAPRRAKPPC